MLKNQMNVTDCLVGRKVLSAGGAAGIVELGPDFSDADISSNSIVQLGEVAGLCNAGEFDATTIHLPLERRKIFGDATDQAILRFAERIHPVADSLKNYKAIHRVPFNSKNKFMIQVIQEAQEEKQPSNLILTIKGAPDILLPKCTHFFSGSGASLPITDEQRRFIEEIKDNWSKQAKRVILLARKNLGQKLSSLSTQSNEFDEEIMKQWAFGLEVVGLVAIVDPPREEIPEVIRILRGAGVKVHMVTGDFRLTAQAIAIDCGIVTQVPERIHDITALQEFGKVQSEKAPRDEESIQSIVLSGPELMALSEGQWDKICKYDEIVFARTSPEQKLLIVKELQKRGEVVGSKLMLPTRASRPS
jgi:sodium/potassium-transporting ATPase subunit alpha